MTKWKKDLAKIIESKSDILNTFPERSVLLMVYKFVDTDNYTQMLFEFGKEYPEICLQYFQDVEDYETCAIILKQVKNFNKTQGYNIELQVS